MNNDEIPALAFDAIAVGQQARLDVEMTPALLDAFAGLTGDVNPLHMSGDFARQKGFPDRLAHGLLTASFFSTIIGTMLPGRDCLLQSARFDFRGPAPVGSRLTLVARVVQKADPVKSLVLEIEAKDASGQDIVTGRIQVGVRP